MKFDVQKYFEVSTIHGFCYVSKRYHIVGRIFWSIALTCSAICSLYLIFMFVIKLIDIPIVVYLSDKAVPISEVNFPAVTICPDFIPVQANHFYDSTRTYFRYEKHSMKEIPYDIQHYFNETADEKKLGKTYRKILDGIEKGEIDHQNLGLKILKRLQVIDMITNRGIFSKLNVSIPNDDFLNIMNEYQKEFLHLQFALNVIWMEDHKQYLSEILTSEGLCFTFNIAYAKDVLHFKNTSNDFHYQLFHLHYTSDSKDLVPPKSLPRKIASSLTGLKMKVDILIMFVKEIYQKNPSGLLIFVHDPYELPSMHSKIFTMDVSQRTHITIDAELNTIDESVVDYTTKQRDCYLDSEKRLKFFKKYTKANCLQECMTDYMIKSCGCVEFFMIRNSTTRICSASEEKCYARARNDFTELHRECGCLRPCNFLKYNLEINLMDLKKYHYYGGQKSLEFTISFKKDSINHFIHKQLYDVMDLLSYAGGFLGLIAGFSLLSFVELFYWFIARAFVKNFHRSTRVQPFTEDSEDQRNFISFGHITHDFLKNSSIHGLRYISKKNTFDKIFWGTFLVGFAIIGIIMILKTNEKLPNNQIITYDDSLKYKENIFFPAITIIPEVTINRDSNDVYSLIRSIKDSELTMMLKNETFKNDVMRTFLKLCICFDNCVSLEYFKNEWLIDGFESDAKKLIQNNPETVWFQEQISRFNDNIQPVFAKIRTRFAMGYTFNIINADELLDFKSINNEFRYFKNITTKQPETTLQMVRSLSIMKGIGAHLELKLKKLKIDKTDGVCKETGILIHNIDAMPTFFKRDDVINVAPGQLDIEVIPEIVKSEEDMKSINSSIRKCYFEGEKSLKFFKKYSEKNCIIECLTNFTLNMCNCTDPSQPFEKENFCHQGLNDRYIYCPSQALKKFHSDENSEENCGCIPTCDSVKYHVRYFYKYASDKDEVEINIRFNSEDAVLFRRYQLFTFSDVVSYVGGLLGLLAGISMLSIVEFFYFFIIRLLVDIHRF